MFKKLFNNKTIDTKLLLMLLFYNITIICGCRLITSLLGVNYSILSFIIITLFYFRMIFVHLEIKPINNFNMANFDFKHYNLQLSLLYNNWKIQKLHNNVFIRKIFFLPIIEKEYVFDCKIGIAAANALTNGRFSNLSQSLAMFEIVSWAPLLSDVDVEKFVNLVLRISKNKSLL